MKISTMTVALALVLFLAGLSFGQVVCIKERTANLRSSPSLTGSYVKLQLPLHYPLQVKEENGDFLRVSDFLDREGWVAKSVVAPLNGVVVNASAVNVRSGPGKNHAVIFKARKGVTFRMIQDQMGWVYVEHESGKKGWIFKDLVWGI